MPTPGKYKFDVKASDFANVSPVAIVILKAGYTSSTSYFTSVLAGDNLGIAYDPATAPRPLLANEFVPSGAEHLWHIGDADFNGSSNSQLQMATFGLSAGFPVTQWNAALGPDGQLAFAFFSGACSSTDYDDFEFGNVMVTLNP